MSAGKKTPGPCTAPWKTSGPCQKQLPRRTWSCLPIWQDGLKCFSGLLRTGSQTTCLESVRWRPLSTWKKYFFEQRGANSNRREVHGDGVPEIGTEY